jgi:hypothetical protein
MCLNEFLSVIGTQMLTKAPLPTLNQFYNVVWMMKNRNKVVVDMLATPWLYMLLKLRETTKKYEAQHTFNDMLGWFF